MRGLLAALALTLSAIGSTSTFAQDHPAPPAAPDPETLALAQQVVDMAFPPERRETMYARLIDTMMAQSRTAVFAAGGIDPDAGEREILDRYLARMRAETERTLRGSTPALFAAFARGYARMFTREELEQIRAFVATPTGAKYVQRSADLLADPDVAQANTAYMTAAFASIQRLQGELRDELIAYHRRQQGQRGTSSPASRP